jgi:hypothetical protein
MGARRCIAIAIGACFIVGCGAPSKSKAPTIEAPVAARTLRFRRTSTGLIRATTTRETWTLELDDRGTILHGILERGAPSTVKTLGDVAWETMGEVSYTSPQRLDAPNVSGERRLEKVGGEDALAFTCAPANVRVRTAGATLIHGDACGGGDGPKPHWEPPTTLVVSVLHCDLPRTKDEVDTENVHAFDFAEGAGVEWVYENSDCSAQEGSLRAMK